MSTTGKTLYLVGICASFKPILSAPVCQWIWQIIQLWHIYALTSFPLREMSLCCSLWEKSVSLSSQMFCHLKLPLLSWCFYYLPVKLHSCLKCYGFTGWSRSWSDWLCDHFDSCCHSIWVCMRVWLFQCHSWHSAKEWQGGGGRVHSCITLTFPWYKWPVWKCSQAEAEEGGRGKKASIDGGWAREPLHPTHSGDASKSSTLSLGGRNGRLLVA